MKKFMMITLVAIGFIVMATPESNAGVSIGIGFGFPGFTDTQPIIRTVTIRTITTLTARLIIGRLSIMVMDTSLIIGGTAARFIIGTATSAKVFSILRARSHPKPALAARMHLGQRSPTQGTQV